MTVADDAYRATRQLIAAATLPAKKEGEDARDLARRYFEKMTTGSDKKCVIHIGPERSEEALRRARQDQDRPPPEDPT